MKTQRFFYFLIIAVFFSACKKEIDYRDKWIGTYECERIRSVSMCPPTGEPCSSYEDTTRVIVNVTTEGVNLLHIEEGRYRDGAQYDVEVNTDGSFKRIDNERPLIEGVFYKDSINMHHRDWSRVAAIYISYEGKKQK